LFTTYYLFTHVPTGFIPQQDQGYLIISITLPDGSTLERTDEVVKEVLDQVLEQPGVKNAVAFVGFSGATRAVSSNAAAIFPVLTDAGERAKEGLLLDKLVGDLRGKLSSNTKANVLVIIPPAIRGIGSGGGFKMQLQARGNNSLNDLLALADSVTGKARQTPGLTQVFSNFRMQTPQQYADIDRVKAQMLSVPPASIFETLQTYLGSTYINDFNMGGRTYRVTAQADYPYRNVTEDIGRLRTRSTTGAIVPLASIVKVHPRTVPDRVVRYNLYPSADVNGDIIPGFSSGYAIDQMEKIAADTIPPGFSYEWTDLAYQEKAAGNTALIIFPLCVLFVFLSLAAQYESWTLPLAIILIVPMCLLFGVMGIMIRGMDNNILTQIGFVVLVGLACKNAILIVEFAKQQEDEGKSRVEAAVTAAALRLRPIMMTSLAFILGVVPLVRATGAGAEMRQSLGTAVFSGMIGVTLFGLILTPVFFVVLRYLFGKKQEVTPEPLAAK
jgi:hydrophobe/amphiphile efflux-1 (HAE1) family protein